MEYSMNRKLRLVSIVGIAAVMLFNLETLASAQTDAQTAPPTETQGAFPEQIPQAPATFRVQPMLKDLPPGVAATETLRTKGQEKLDKKLQFCRNC